MRISRITKFGANGDYQAKNLNKIFNTQEKISFVVNNYQEMTNGKLCVVYAVNQEHSEKGESTFRERKTFQQFPLIAKHPQLLEKRLFVTFKAGKIQVLGNVELFTQAFNVSY